MPAIGIDLGTTNSCVAVHRNGTTDVIINRRGNRTTPSCVSFTKTGRNIGEAGLEQMIRTPENTVVEVKRLIGRKFSEVADTKKLEHWPFVVISENDKPKICVEYQGEKKKFTAEEISAMILEEMKRIAEAFLDEKVEDAVITVPAYFNDSQRQATKDAARIAGLNVLRLINEPTAAAIAYGLNKKIDKPFKILTFDIGGGTFDVSILEVEGAKFTVKSTGGDTDLGGADFDSRLIDHCVKMFKRDHGVDLTDNRRAMMRLRFACEKTKKALSNSEQADLIVDALHDGLDLDTTICRAYFDQLNLDLFERTLETTKRTIKDAGLTKNQIDHVVLVGGSTRIVKVQKMLQEYFEGKDLKHSINPDEAVACGAAMLAASLSGDKSGPVSDIKLLDVNPLSLGVAEGGTNMQNIIDRNTTLPTKNTRMFTNASDNQSCALVQIFEGERPRAQDNHKLGELELNLIERGPRGFSKLEVTFALDVNGILKVFAVETATGQSKSITIKGTNRLSDLEIQKMISEAKMYEKEDKRYREQAAARNQLIDYVYSLKHSLENDKAKTVCWNKAKEAFLEMCLDTISWLEENTDAEKEEYLSKTNKLKIQSGLTSTEQ